MKLVIDTNVLFSFFRKDSTTRRLILNFEILELSTPSFCLDELREHRELVCEKSALSDQEFEEALNALSIFVRVFPHNEYKEFMRDARDISPDTDDIDLFALALKLGCPIWSEDGRLKDQSKVKVFSTRELIELLHEAK